MAAIAASEAVVRIAVFVAVFGLLAIFELWSPRLERGEMAGALKSRRWLTNLGLVVASSALLRLVFPAASRSILATAQPPPRKIAAARQTASTRPSKCRSI